MASADSLRQRKPVEGVTSNGKPTNTPREEEDDSKRKRAESDPDLEPNIWVLIWMIVVFMTGISLTFYYKFDNRNQGPFAAYINEKFPVVDRTLNNYALGNKEAPLFGAAAAETTGLLSLTEEELKEFDGSDPEKPIYLGINGTIFDVSASPAFYGPGGHYNHFVGKDATRAWITECWDEPEQFTWRLDDVEVMFMPKYMDEMLTDVGEGDFEGDLGAMGAMPQEMLKTMAEKALARFGKVGPKMRAKRRIADKEEADAKVQETLAHWVNFFANNKKYETVGRVILDESLPAPPAPCKKAMEKRPLKGGKLESLMGSMGNLMGGAGAGADAAGAGAGTGAKTGEMPAAVREQIEKAKKQAAAAKDGAAEGAETVGQKVKDTADAAADTAESVKDEAGKKAQAATDAAGEGAEAVKEKAKAAGESYDSVKDKAQKVKNEAVKQAAEAVAAGAEKVKQKAEEVKAGHEEL